MNYYEFSKRIKIRADYEKLANICENITDTLLRKLDIDKVSFAPILFDLNGMIKYSKEYPMHLFDFYDESDVADKIVYDFVNDLLLYDDKLNIEINDCIMISLDDTFKYTVKIGYKIIH